MAKVKFRLNKGLIEPELKEVKSVNPEITGLHPDKEYTIYLRYRRGNVDFNAALEFSVIPDHWNFETQRAIEKKAVLEHEEINSLITNLTKHFTDWDLTNKREGLKPSYNDVKRHYQSYFTISTDEPKKIELFDLIELFINQDSSLKRKKVKDGTIKTYKTTKEVLVAFQKYWGKLTFDSIDLDFYYDFVEWCEKKKTYSKNYIGKNIKTIKTLMSYALENNLTSNGAFKSKNFEKLTEEADNIYLSLEELQDIWELDLSKEPRKERARDLFLIGAYTGLRVSDFNNLSNHQIKTVKGVQIISVPTTKTDKKVSVPLHPIVRAILDKRNGELPQRLADQTINELIKECAEDAGIDSIEYVKQTKGGMEVTTKMYKFDRVKTHTARRSFCSNAYLSGMDPIDIMAISGHSSRKDFMKYILVGPDDIAIKMSTNAFFTGATAMKKVK